MTPTRVRTLLLAAVLLAALGYLLDDRAYGSLVALPGYAPVTAALIAAFEAGLSRVVHDKVHGRSRGRPMHPLQVARAVVLAKASALAGALLLGLYAGMFAWTFPRRATLAAAGHDARVAGLSALAGLALCAAALLLEHACRTPSRDAQR